MTENVSLTGVASAASIDGKASATPTAAARRQLLNRMCEPPCATITIERRVVLPGKDCAIFSYAGLSVAYWIAEQAQGWPCKEIRQVNLVC